VEWDEDILTDPNAIVIGRIERIDEEKLLSLITYQTNTTITWTYSDLLQQKS